MSTFSTTTASLSDAAKVAAECRDLMQSLVGPARRRLGSAKAAHAAIARSLGMNPRRVRAYLLGEVLRVPAWEADRLRDAVQRAYATQIADLEHEIEALRRRAGAGTHDTTGPALLRC